MSAAIATTAGSREQGDVSSSQRPRRVVRAVGGLFLAIGLCLVTWTVVVWQWQDPFTALYTLYEQHKLTSRYEKVVAEYHPLLATLKVQSATRPDQGTPYRNALFASERRLVAVEARRYRRHLRPGDPIGRIKVPRLGLSIILVAGTDHDSLTKGPGWYSGSFLPGEGQLIYIAGHRTTYLAPFAHIDSLRPGDSVTIELPYGTFLYRVRSHVIVAADDLTRLRSHGQEVVALQACHPRFFATHRYIVYAYPVRVSPRAGRPYVIG